MTHANTRSEVERAAEALSGLADRLAEADTPAELALALHEIADADSGVIGALAEVLEAAQTQCIPGDPAHQVTEHTIGVLSQLGTDLQATACAFDHAALALHL